MKLLKTSVAEYHRLERKAIRNRGINKQGENSVEGRWNINEHGNVIFDGFLKDRDTWYPTPLRDGFYVVWDYANQQAAVSGTNELKYLEIPQNILNDIYKAMTLESI
jgi:hypothetical protein